MSNAILQGGASGTGSVTLLAPNTNSTQTLTLPDNTGTLVGTASTGVVSAPMLNGNQSGSAPIYGCRAWCTFDGTLTGTNAPTANGNVTSIIRNGVGDYTVNFTVGMQDANYSIVVNQGRGSSATTNVISISPFSTDPTAFSFRIGTFNASFASVDAKYVNVSIFR